MTRIGARRLRIQTLVQSLANADIVPPLLGRTGRGASCRSGEDERRLRARRRDAIVGTAVGGGIDDVAVSPFVTSATWVGRRRRCGGDIVVSPRRHRSSSGRSFGRRLHYYRLAVCVRA